MLSKEEILARRIIKFPSDDIMVDDAIKINVYAVMDEYAKLQATAFANFIYMNNIGHLSIPEDIRSKYIRASGDQLYDVFIEHQSKTK